MQTRINCYPAASAPHRPTLTPIQAPCRPRKGSVKLVFEAPDGEEVHFERVIKPTGAAAESFTSEVGAARQLALGLGLRGGRQTEAVLPAGVR